MQPRLWAELGISADDMQRECEDRASCRPDGICEQDLGGSKAFACACVQRHLPRRSLGEGGRMRIVVAHDSVDTEGGVETYLLSVIRALGDRGHQIALLYHRRSRSRVPPLERARGGGVEERGMDAALTAAVVETGRGFLAQHGATGRRLSADRRWPVVKMLHGYFGTCVSGQKMHAFPSASGVGRTFGPACLALYFPRRCGQLAPGAMVQGYRWAGRATGALFTLPR